LNDSDIPLVEMHESKQYHSEYGESEGDRSGIGKISD